MGSTPNPPSACSATEPWPTTTPRSAARAATDSIDEPHRGGPIDPDPSLSEWLARGGDHRLLPNGPEQLSKYRVATHPTDAVPLGSCTASSPSERGLEAAGRLLEQLRGASDPIAGFEHTAEVQRARLRALFEIGDDHAIALSPSGTDALYLVSCLALGAAARVHHVVVGASELGGGTVRASVGRSISDVGPFGPETVDAPLDGLADRCTAEAVYLRDREGRRIDIDDVDRATAVAVGAAAEKGAVVLHLVVHSKTGLRAPSAALASDLVRQFGDRVLVVVDAAQGRIAPRDVRESLSRGFAVLFTGSKFYSGPPFSGALILPPGRSADPGLLPASLGRWLSRAELPPHWGRARASLTEPGNPGLLLRWEAALAEIEAYHSIEPRFRAGVYHAFSAAVYEVFGPSSVLLLDVPEPPVHELASALGAFPSVYGFKVRGREGLLPTGPLKRLHTLLDTDMGDEEPVLGGRFHLGQPVALGPPQDGGPAVLRVALGARLVTDLAHRPDEGGPWFRQVMHRLRAKAERLVMRGDLEGT